MEIDYEKEYKAMVQRARELHETGNELTRRQMEIVCHELRESEDEEIRKHIIDLVKDNAKAKSIPCDAEIAYLEKQKDASKAIEAVERIDKYIDRYLANAHDMDDSNPYKKYYRGWDDALGEMAGILQDVYSNEKQKESLHIQKTCKENADSFTDEDERIRKWLVDYFKAVERCCIHWDISPERIVSYLEKQKPGNVSATTMAPSCWEVEQKEQKHRWEINNPHKTKWTKEMIDERFEELLESKPAWSEEDESFLDSIEDAISSYYDLNHAPQYHYWLEEKLKSLRSQSKVEWSEEDQKSLNRAINICISDFGEDSETARFLKSLPERFILQPKQEWSEEDEEKLERVDDLLWMLDDYLGDDCSICEERTARLRDEIQKELCPWLKSLRPQPRWKPSEEQMRVLKQVEDRVAMKDGYWEQVLDSLYLDLQKL